MNIKEHIEAGHYPADEKGRALVPTRDGTAVILATDNACSYCIVGWDAESVKTWTAGGQNKTWSGSRADLLPPSPRKVKVTSYAIFTADNQQCSWQGRPFTPDDYARIFGRGHRPVVLTGEYEEPWS